MSHGGGSDQIRRMQRLDRVWGWEPIGLIVGALSVLFVALAVTR